MKRDPRNIRIVLSRSECRYLLSALGGFEHPDSRRSRQLQKFICECRDAQSVSVQSPAKPSGKPVRRTGRTVSQTGDEAEQAGRDEYKRITEDK